MNMKENTRKLVYNILSGKSKQIKDSLKAALGAKLNTQLEVKRQKVAKDLFKK
jgi:hypothetical protein